jgi:hypothetical protein
MDPSPAGSWVFDGPVSPLLFVLFSLLLGFAVSVGIAKLWDRVLSRRGSITPRPRCPSCGSLKYVRRYHDVFECRRCRKLFV